MVSLSEQSDPKLRLVGLSKHAMSSALGVLPAGGRGGELLWRLCSVVVMWTGVWGTDPPRSGRSRRGRERVVLSVIG